MSWCFLYLYDIYRVVGIYREAVFSRDGKTVSGGTADEEFFAFGFDDKASPEVIKREFGLSKNAFKRAVGHLLKEGKIEIKDKRIYKK